MHVHTYLGMHVVTHKQKYTLSVFFFFLSFFLYIFFYDNSDLDVHVCVQSVLLSHRVGALRSPSISKNGCQKWLPKTSSAALARAEDKEVPSFRRQQHTQPTKELNSAQTVRQFLDFNALSTASGHLRTTRSTDITRIVKVTSTEI